MVLLPAVMKLHLLYLSSQVYALLWRNKLSNKLLHKRYNKA